MRVRWPDGSKTILDKVATNQILVLDQADSKVGSQSEAVSLREFCSRT
ncbi:MAG: hypothetical protein U5K54_24050 [Cytophagales bacterium]|nr:hypothetical protein [Cytophagales bacterium]